MKEDEFEDEVKQVRAHVRNRQHEAALARAETLIANAPERYRSRALRWRAYVHEGAKRYDEALEDLGDAIAHNTEIPANYDARIMLNLKLGRYQAVEADCTRLLEIENHRQSIWFVNAALISRGLARVRLGRSEDALEDFEKVDDEGPFRLERRTWMKQDLIALARSKLK